MIDSATFERKPGSVKQARRFVTDRLQGYDSALVDDVVLMTSELVTNSIQYSTSVLTLTVEVDARTIRVAVTDAGPGRPRIQYPQPQEPSGRGLQLVAKLAEEWGAGSNGDGGNTVWFSLQVDANSRPQHANKKADVLLQATPATTQADEGPQGPPRRPLDFEPPPSMALTRPPNRPSVAPSCGVNRYCTRRSRTPHGVATRRASVPQPENRGGRQV